MTRPPIPDPVAALLAANGAFYDAFNSRDVAAMEALWAEDAPVACLHPGWTPVLGREAVMAAWAGILGNPDSPLLTCESPQAMPLNAETGLVVCLERVGDALLAATNLFVLEGGVWRMVLHQAGPSAVTEEPPRREPPPPPRRRLH
jgi:hypothetical protein